jgi:hypothetical protein
MSYTSTGEVIALTPIEHVGNNGMAKRQLVIKFKDGEYEKMQPFALLKDRAEKCTAQVGNRVVVSWDYNGREWKGKYYADAVAWKIEVQGQAGSVQQQAQQPAPFHPDNDKEESVPF